MQRNNSQSVSRFVDLARDGGAHGGVDLVWVKQLLVLSLASSGSLFLDGIWAQKFTVGTYHILNN